MKSINFTLLASDLIAKEFGKKGTSTDLTIYDKKNSDSIKTWTVPNGFPEKIQPLFQSINMGEYVIFYVEKLDKFTGEQIIALDSLKKNQGLLCHSYEVDRSKLMTLIKGTSVENFKLVEFPDVKPELDKFPPLSNQGDLKIVIDHSFDVKGVGTVVLGKVLQGKVKTYDNLKILPKNSDVTIKSIQMHDETVEEAICPARVGLSLKGISHEEIQRGDLLMKSNNWITSQELSLNFNQNNFFKGSLAESQMILVNIGLQIKSAKIVSLNPLKLSLSKPVVFEKDELGVILKPESTPIRIVGNGTII